MHPPKQISNTVTAFKAGTIVATFDESGSLSAARTSPQPRKRESRLRETETPGPHTCPTGDKLYPWHCQKRYIFQATFLRRLLCPLCHRLFGVDVAVGELKVDPVPCDMERDTKKSVGPEGGWIWMVWGGVGCVWVLPPAKLRPFVNEVHVQKIRNKKRPPPPILAISAKAIGLLLNVDVELWVTMQNVQLPAWKTTQTSRHTLPAFRVHVHGIYHTSSLPPEKTTQTSRYIITWL